MGCYAAKGKLDEGYVYIGDQHNARQQSREAAGFYQSAVEVGRVFVLFMIFSMVPFTTS
jgi:hypothetical protein